MTRWARTTHVSSVGDSTPSSRGSKVTLGSEIASSRGGGSTGGTAFPKRRENTMARKRTWRGVDSSPLAFHIANDLDRHGAHERELACVGCGAHGERPNGAHDVFHLSRLEELDRLE